MSFKELFFRGGQYLQKTKEKYFDHKKIFPQVPFLSSSRILNIEPNQIEYTDIIGIFGNNVDISKPINWHLDLLSLKEFPRFFSKNISIQSDKYGSAKHVWEINRLLFLPRICFNYLNTGNTRHIHQFINITRNWIQENKYLNGINWYSNIEVNIRLINWFLCWEILHSNTTLEKSTEFKDFINNEWIPEIYKHCLYSYKNPSRYSSSNNHLIAEYSGLFIATSLWKFKESDKWNAYAKKGLEIEILRQYSENGINKEEAAEYIQFITDFFLLAYVVAEKTHNDFSVNYKNRLRKIFEYIHQFTDKDGNFPRYGDEDDGKVLIVDPDWHYNNFRSLLVSGALIFKDDRLKAKAIGYDAKNKMLFGQEGEKLFDHLEKKDVDLSSIFYPEEGHFILRKQHSGNEIYIHFDAAPLGYLSIAAHGHADALSFSMHVNGKEVIADPGTYAYHTDTTWRQYFIGTLAHNTIRVNRENQAVNGGSTLWLDHYNARVLEYSSGFELDKVVATHDGYKKMGVTHIREMLFNKSKKTLTITDRVEVQSGTCFIEFPLHIHPDFVLMESNKHFLINSQYGAQAVIQCDPKFKTEIRRGKVSPILGWYSRSFYKKEPNDVLYQFCDIQESTSFETIISINI